MWETLGIESTRDEGTIRRAYAVRARMWRPESHPMEFSRLREAYEAALRWARATAQAQEPAPDDFQDTVPSAFPSSQPPVAQPAAPPPYAAAEALVQQLGRDWSEGGAAKGVETLRVQHGQVTQGSVDAKLEWETVLLHSFLTAGTPPLALVFEADRLLRWMDRLGDVARMFGEPAAQRLRLVLDMAYESTYARHFSPNRWHARLFGARPATWFGATALLVSAGRTAEYWRQLCQAGNFDEMTKVLDAKALRRTTGLAVMSCDVLFAGLVAWAGWMLARDSFNPPTPLALAAWTAAGFALMVPLPLACRWARRSAAGRGFVGWWAWLKNVPGIVTALAAIIVFVGAAVAAAPENPIAVRIPAIVLLVAAGAAFYGFLMTVVWIVVRWLEWLACIPWLWLLRTWGNLRFDHARRGLDAPALGQQLRHLAPAAAQSWTAFRARRREAAERRKQQSRAGKPTFATAGANWWWIFVAIALVNLLSRLAK